MHTHVTSRQVSDDPLAITASTPREEQFRHVAKLILQDALRDSWEHSTGAPLGFERASGPREYQWNLSFKPIGAREQQYTFWTVRDTETGSFKSVSLGLSEWEFSPRAFAPANQAFSRYHGKEVSELLEQVKEILEQRSII